MSLFSSSHSLSHDEKGSSFVTSLLILLAIVLGLVASFPNWYSLLFEPRDQAFKNLNAALQTAAKLANRQQRSERRHVNDSITMDGKAIRMKDGYPIADDIQYSLGSYINFKFIGNGWFIWTGNGATHSKDCAISYKAAKSSVLPIIKIHDKGCKKSTSFLFDTDIALSKTFESKSYQEMSDQEINEQLKKMLPKQ